MRFKPSEITTWLFLTWTSVPPLAWSNTLPFCAAGFAFECFIMFQGHSVSSSLLNCPRKKWSHKNFFCLINACAEPELLFYKHVKENRKRSGLHFFFHSLFYESIICTSFLRWRNAQFFSSWPALSSHLVPSAMGLFAWMLRNHTLHCNNNSNRAMSAQKAELPL